MDNQRALTTQSSRIKSIRAGMCVLVVDDDIKSLNIVAVMLRALQYEVVPVKRMSDALDVLQERQGRLDIILTVLHMPKMDGISLLEHVEAEFKIPVVMMSANDDEFVASICLDSGASFYLTKPLTISDLSNLWQYVYLKKRYERMAIEQIGSDSELSTPKKVSKGDNECTSSVNESSWRQESWEKNSTRKNQNKGENNEDNMPRVTWTTELHNKFLDAIDQIGLQGAVPMKILEVMNTPGLTREKVASHLQKYRKFLKRIKQASQSSEPSVIKSVRHATFKSKIASGHPSLERVFSCISRQQKCSTSQLGDENPIPKRKQERLKQPSLDKVSSVNQQNDGTSSPSQMETPNTREGSSMCGSTPTTLASNTDTLLMIHQELQERTKHFSHGSLDHGLNTTSLPSENIQNVKNMRSFNNLNQGPSFSYTNNGLVGIQMNSSTAKVSGFSQMNNSHDPANGTSCGYSSRDEIRNEKRHLVDTKKSPPIILGFTSSHSDYASQGLTSSSGLMPQGLAPTSGLVTQGSISSSGFNQVHIGHELANGTSCGRRNEIQNGKGSQVDIEKSPLIPRFTSSHFDYASQGVTSSSSLMPQGLAPNGGLVPQGSISSSGFNHMHVGHKPVNSTNCGYSGRDEIQNGKRPLVDTEKSPFIPRFTSSHSDYASHGLTSSSGLMPQGLAPTYGLVPQGSISSSGFNQMHIGYEPAKGTSFGYSMREEIRNGKRPLVETGVSPFIPEFTSSHSDYASQGLTSNGLISKGLAPISGLVPQGSISSNGFSSTNPFSPIFTNVSQQLPLLSPLPPPPPPSHQQQKKEIRVAEEVNSSFDLMKNNSSLDVECDLSDILFKTTDQSPNQHGVCGGVVIDPEFSINDYHVDDDYTSLWIPP